MRSKSFLLLREFLRHHYYKYLISIAIVALATIVQKSIYKWVEPTPYLLYYPAIIFATMYGDGISAIILSVICAQYFFIQPDHELTMQWPDDYIRMIVFVLFSIIVRRLVRKQTVERLKAEAAVDLLKKKETDLLIEKDRREKFVAMLNHDLQNPLSAIKLHAEMMMKKSIDPEVVKKLSARQLEAVQRMEKTIQHLLDANRIQAGQAFHLDMTHVDLTKLLKEAIEEFKSVHGDRFQSKKIETIEGYWNPDALRRIIDNLCSNAIKYGDPGKKVTVDLLKATDGIILGVHNSGPAIPEKELKNMFNPYSRLEAAIKSKEKGWGLGLALVQALTQAHGGKVSVESNENGTTFSVYLPLDARDFKSLP